MKTGDEKRTSADAGGMMKCADIQAALFDYLARELGEGRSDLIREHLRRCPRCQPVAAEIQQTLDLLHRAADDRAGLPRRLSEKRRARMLLALTHPALDWIHRHHILVSLILAAVVTAVAALLLRGIDVLKSEIPQGVTVTIGEGRAEPQETPSAKDTGTQNGQ